jgi:hypothetical protein
VSPMTIRILLSLAIQVLKMLRKHYGTMTPEQKEEYRKICIEMKDPMGGDGSGP